jgi:hypothetical protein
VEEGLGVVERREAALLEREAAAKEVERLRNVVRRQRKDLRAKMLEVSREEAERKRMLDERANYRFQVFGKSVALFCFYLFVEFCVIYRVFWLNEIVCVVLMRKEFGILCHLNCVCSF